VVVWCHTPVILGVVGGYGRKEDCEFHASLGNKSEKYVGFFFLFLFFTLVAKSHLSLHILGCCCLNKLCIENSFRFIGK
jgi:hypothetical protein